MRPERRLPGQTMPGDEHSSPVRSEARHKWDGRIALNPRGFGGRRPPSSSKPPSDWFVLSFESRGSVRGGGARCDLGTPTSRTALEDMAVMQKPIKHGRDGRHVAQQFAPIFDGTVGSEQRAGALVAPHNNLQQIFG